MINPYDVTIRFEEALAEFCGSMYAVCVESCTSAIFLSLMWRKMEAGYYDIHSKTSWRVLIPKNTYPGVACSILHAGMEIDFDGYWQDGEYELDGMNIWDAALRFKRGMFSHDDKALQCLSFHQKKNLPIGRGGAILTNDFEAVKWLRRARFDGRNPVPLQEDQFDMLGWNCYLQPEQAARGLALMQMILTRYPDGPPDLLVEDQGYPNLDLFDVYKR